jgi:hypothetical protein
MPSPGSGRKTIGEALLAVYVDADASNEKLVWKPGLYGQSIEGIFENGWCFSARKLRGVLDVGDTLGSTLLVRMEDVVLRLHGRMARVAAV